MTQDNACNGDLSTANVNFGNLCHFFATLLQGMASEANQEAAAASNDIVRDFDECMDLRTPHSTVAARLEGMFEGMGEDAKLPYKRLVLS